jgi:hypothetical protein
VISRCYANEEIGAMPADTDSSAGDVSEERFSAPDRSRPRSVSLIVGVFLVLFGGGYLMMAASLITGSSGLTIGRILVEPPVVDGGVDWPGWDMIGAMLANELEPLESLAARYWWTKLNLVGGILIGPLLIAGLLGVFLGRGWGRVCVYGYLSVWLANKTVYLFLLGVAGVPKFSIAVGITVVSVLAVRSKSWSAWLDGSVPRVQSGPSGKNHEER